MHSGEEQTSLWQQSDLLDLVAAAEAPERQTPSPIPTATTELAAAGAAAQPDPQRDAEDGLHSGPPQRQESPQAASSPEAPCELADPALAPSCQAATASLETIPPGRASAVASAPGSQGARRDPEAGAAAGDSGKQPADRLASGSSSPEAAPRPTAAPQDSASTGPAPAPGTATPPISAGASELPACPQRLLILDTETTALSPDQGQCIELGAVLFDVASRSVLMQVSFLLPCDHNAAQAVNGIPAPVSRLQQPWRSGLACFEAMVAGADALLAHNAAFDRQWFGSGELPALQKPWICSMEDIRWPAERQLRATPSVRDLALAYEVPVWAAHRALTDCTYLVQVFQRCDDLEALLQVALEPRRLVRARLSYDERQLARDAGFRWNEPVPKAWTRRLSDREIAELPFAVDPVEAEEPGRTPRPERAPLWRRSA